MSHEQGSNESRFVGSYVPTCFPQPTMLRPWSGSFLPLFWSGSSFCSRNVRINMLGWPIWVGLCEPGRSKIKPGFYISKRYAFLSSSPFLNPSQAAAAVPCPFSGKFFAVIHSLPSPNLVFVHFHPLKLSFSRYPWLSAFFPPLSHFSVIILNNDDDYSLMGSLRHLSFISFFIFMFLYVYLYWSYNFSLEWVLTNHVTFPDFTSLHQPIEPT